MEGVPIAVQWKRRERKERFKLDSVQGVGERLQLVSGNNNSSLIYSIKRPFHLVLQNKKQKTVHGVTFVCSGFEILMTRVCCSNGFQVNTLNACHEKRQLQWTDLPHYGHTRPQVPALHSYERDEKRQTKHFSCKILLFLASRLNTFSLRPLPLTEQNIDIHLELIHRCLLNHFTQFLSAWCLKRGLRV